ncbi:MAG: hypothetical protein AAGD01_11795 [Acidobacteriota bacterium]
MVLVEERVRWRSYFATVVELYQRALSHPIAEFLRSLELRFSIDLSWIPPWFPDYLPIASVFTMGLVSGYAHLTGTTPFHIFHREVSDVAKTVRNEGWDSVPQLVFGLVAFLLFWLTSPAFVILFPLLMLAIFFGGIFIYLVILTGLLRLVLLYILPWLSLIVGIFGITWFLRGRVTFLSFEEKLWYRLRHSIARRKRRSAHVLFKLSQGFRESVTEARTEVSEGTRLFTRLFVVQYAIAAAVFAVFLTFLTINNVFFH